VHFRFVLMRRLPKIDGKRSAANVQFMKAAGEDLVEGSMCVIDGGVEKRRDGKLERASSK
jgi:hypothetical protein